MNKFTEAISAFEDQRLENIEKISADTALNQFSRTWMQASAKYKYTLNFSWMGRPIIQFLQDILAFPQFILTELSRQVLLMAVR
jgi:cephalosporin hydroxylase